MSIESYIAREADARAKFSSALAAFNEALAGNDNNVITNAENGLKQAESEYAKEREALAFAQYAEEENPILALIQNPYYAILHHKANREDGVLTSVSQDEKTTRADLAKFMSKHKDSILWVYMLDKLVFLFTVKAAKDLGGDDAAIAEIQKSYRWRDEAKKDIDMGKNPVSNNQMEKSVQSIVDAILPGVFKVRKCDISYISMALTKAGRDPQSIAVSKTRVMQGILLDAMNNMMNNGGYLLTYDKKKEKQVEESKPEEQTAEEIKTVEEEAAE